MYGMRRTILTAAVLLAAATAHAINTGMQPIRIALLPPLERSQVSDHVRDLLAGELRKLGYDAFPTDNERPRADFYLDVAGAGGGSRPLGGIEVGGRNAAIDIGVIVSRVAASVTLYDGRTLERLQTIDLQKRNTAIAPTAVGIGGRSIWASIALPVVEWSQQRAALRAVARDAARQIDQALRR